MPVSSLIVRVKEEKKEFVLKSLKEYAAAEISDVLGESIVLITDTESQAEDKKLWQQIEEIPGVLQCDLIYHNFEDEERFNHE